MSSHVSDSTEAIRHKLLDDVNGLISSARRSYRLRATLLWSAGAIGILMLLICVDMILRREEIGLRVLFFLLWTTASVLTAVRWLAPAWKFSPTRFEIARWIEHAQPELGERLSSAVQFAETPMQDSRYGSPQFRDAILRGWSLHANPIAWSSYIDHSSWIRAALLLLSALGVAGAFAISSPSELGLGVARLLQPWSALPWPQADQLEFVELPTAIANGQELQLEIIDRVMPMPTSIEVLVRDAEGDSKSEAVVYSANNLTEIAVVTLPSVDRAIEIRAVGGEDRNMPWRRIDVAQPPKLDNYQFEVTPPTYTQRPPTKIVGNRIQVLAGTQVAFRGRFEEPIKQIEAVTQNLSNTTPHDQAQTDTPNTATAQSMNTFDIQLDAEGRVISLDVCDENTPKGTLSWRLRVTTLAGVEITLPEVWGVEVLEDAIPVVVLAEQKLPQISTEATLPLVGNASDDLGLNEVSVRWQVETTDTTEPGKWILWSSVAGSTARREYALDQTWELESSIPLVAGQRIQIWLEAKDTLGQIGKSSPQTLEVSDSHDVLESIAGRQSQLLEQMRAITEAQRRNSQLAGRNREIIQQAGTVRREELDALANVSQMQQSVNRQLSADRNSVMEGLRTLQQLLANNQLTDTDIAIQIDNLEKQVERIGAESLTSAARDAQAALDQAKSHVSDSGKLSQPLIDALAKSEASQSSALNDLQSLTDRLTQSESLRVVERELAQILGQQQTLRRDTDNLEIRRLGGMSKEEFQANRAGLQADQQGLAQTLDQLEKRAKGLANDIPKNQAALRSQIEQALTSLAKSQASGRMRTATEDIASDRFARAAETQQGVVEALREALQKLSSSSQRSLEGQLGQMQAASTEIGALAADQRALADKMAASNATTNSAELGTEQSRLEQATRDQQSKAAQAGDQRTEQALENATSKQAEAKSETEKQQLSQAAKLAREAAEELASAAKNAQARAAQIEREVAQQQAMQLAAALNQLVSQQQAIVTKLNDTALVQLDVKSDEQKKANEQELRQLAGRQEAVRQMVRDVRERAQKLPAFDWTLEQAEGDMTRAVAAVQRFRIAPEATNSASRALRKLEQAAQAMKKSPQSEANSGDDADEQNASDNQERNNRPAPPIASLKLLRAVQADINQETLQINDDVSTMDLSERAQRIEQLSQQQQALGAQIEQLLRELEAATDNNQ